MNLQFCSLYKRLTLWKLMIVIPLFYLISVWWGYQYIEKQLQDYRKSDKVFKPRFNQDGKLQLYSQHCPIYYHPRLHHGPQQSGIDKNLAKCPLYSSTSITDIQMETEWNYISVKYPQYVYTVSGWIQVIDVPNYTPKPLKVIIVPHSHQDPGWKESYDGYYMDYTRNTLNHIISRLKGNPKLKFVWAEITYLKKWYGEKESDKKGLLEVLRSGQLEIVTGGWVMTDEAVSHYGAMLNQLVDGHLWVRDTLGLTPNTSWSIDPFGHSPTMTYLLSQAGISNMVIQRTHFGVKRHFAKRQNLEFFWKQTWDPTGGSTVLCHMMPFLLYAIPYSCGPDPHVCCKFDFHKEKCFYGTKTVPTLSVDEKNIRKLAWSLWEQFQKKSQLYRSNVLLVPHGDDFRYSSLTEWNSQFDNLGRLINYMNVNEDMNIQIQYGTISDYFNALEQDRKEQNFDYPSLSGDFLPYNDRDDQYWTGFFSVRPLLKHMVRVLQAKLRITEILYTLACSQLEDRQDGLTFCNSQRPALVEGRHALNLLHHHDAITGTSKHYVMNNYAKILKVAMEHIDSLLLELIVRNADRVLSHSSKLDPKHFILTEKWNSHSSHPVLQVNQLKGKWIVVVTNPLAIPWKSPVTVATTSPFIVKLGADLIPSQVNPVWDSNFQPVKGHFNIVFEADLPALAVQVYHFIEDSDSALFAHVAVTGAGLDEADFSDHFHTRKISRETFDIENDVLRATFSSCHGTLQYTHNKVEDEVHHTAIQMVTYGTGSFMNPFKDKSGAYIFMPDGPAKEMDVRYPPVIVVRGPVMSSVTTKLPGVTHTATLYNINGPVAKGVHIQNTVDLGTSEWDNKEVAMRVVSDVMSPDTSVCVDLNGFQMLKKKWRSKFLIQGNFHPVTTAAFIENEESSRLTLLTSEVHGMASLGQGWLEATLDRRLMQDDWRGLNEGPHDNPAVPSNFIIIPEKKKHPGELKGPTCFLSPTATLLSQHLNNPPQTAVMVQGFSQLPDVIPNVPSTSLLQVPLPCPNFLLNLRHDAGTFEQTAGARLAALLIVHRVGVDCNFANFATDCQAEKSFKVDMFTDSEMERAVETSITGTEELQDLPSFIAKLNDMEIKTIRVTFSNSKL